MTSKDAITSVRDSLILKRAELAGRLQQLDDVIVILKDTTPAEPDRRVKRDKSSKNRFAKPRRTVRNILGPTTVKHLEAHGRISSSELARQYKMKTENGRANSVTKTYRCHASGPTASWSTRSTSAEMRRPGPIVSGWHRSFKTLGFEFKEVMERTRNEKGENSYALTPHGLQMLNSGTTEGNGNRRDDELSPFHPSSRATADAEA